MWLSRQSLVILCTPLTSSIDHLHLNSPRQDGALKRASLGAKDNENCQVRQRYQYPCTIHDHLLTGLATDLASRKPKQSSNPNSLGQSKRQVQRANTHYNQSASTPKTNPPIHWPTRNKFAPKTSAVLQLSAVHLPPPPRESAGSATTAPNSPPLKSAKPSPNAVPLPSPLHCDQTSPAAFYPAQQAVTV